MGRRGSFWHLLTETIPATQPDPIRQHLNSSEKSPCSAVQEEKSDEGMAGWKELPIKWQVGQ